jgi:hypothetical protein
MSPLNGLAEVAEVVDLVQFVESAPFVNGEVIHLDGGAHAGKCLCIIAHGGAIEAQALAEQRCAKKD